MAINESEILPSTLDLKIIEDENNKLEEKVNSFEALKVKIGSMEGLVGKYLSKILINFLLKYNFSF